MLIIYSPNSVPHNIQKELEYAFEMDEARITYVGNDESDEFVVLEAKSFKNTRKLEKSKGLKLIFQIPA